MKFQDFPVQNVMPALNVSRADIDRNDRRPEHRDRGRSRDPLHRGRSRLIGRPVLRPHGRGALRDAETGRRPTQRGSLQVSNRAFQTPPAASHVARPPGAALG
jgi:hypothetical protein